MDFLMRFQAEKLALREAAIRNLACQECGMTIVPDAMFCQRCHAPIVRRYCAGCSRLVPENSAFCPFCGTSAKQPVPEHLSLISRAIPIAACVLILIFFIARQNKTATTSASLPVAQKIAGAGGSGSAGSSQLSLNVQSPPTVAKVESVVTSVEGRRLNVQAHELMKVGNYAEAIPLLVQAVRAFGDNSKDDAYPYALFNLAQSLRLSGKPHRALPILQNLIKDHSENELFQHELSATQFALSPGPAATSNTQN